MAEHLPHTVKGVLDLLEQAYPEKCAQLHESERQIFIRTGHREVVAFLRDLQKRTEETQLKQTLEK